MSAHAFEPKSVNPLSCKVCSEPKAAADHRTALAMIAPSKSTDVAISFKLPAPIYADLQAAAEKAGKKVTPYATSILVAALGYEYVPAQPKQVLPARPAAWRKKGLI